MTKPSWPTHQDGRPKKVGEMTKDESRAVFQAAADRVKAEIESPEMQAAMEEVFNGDKSTDERSEALRKIVVS